MVTSLHIPPFAALARSVRQADAPWCRYTVTSARQAAIWWPKGTPANVDIVHNGIDPAAWPYRPGGDGSAVWAGRITETKGAHLAAEAAIRADITLTLYGVIENSGYFREKVVPLLSDRIRYGGHLEGGALARAYARASLFLFTPLWEEPFGLAAVEAMATGLPVAALPMGAAREVIGDAGCVAVTPDADALARIIPDALRIPPARARARVARFFAMDRMVDGYERCYAAARDGLRARIASSAIGAA